MLTKYKERPIELTAEVLESYPVVPLNQAAIARIQRDAINTQRNQAANNLGQMAIGLGVAACMGFGMIAVLGMIAGAMSPPDIINRTTCVGWNVECVPPGGVR